MRQIRYYITPSPLLGIALFFFIPWWIALIVLLGGFASFPWAQKAAAKGVLEASLDTEYVFQLAVDNEVIKIKEVSK